MQPATDTRFRRGQDRILGGVCSGLAAGFHVDSLWVRIAFVLLAFVQGLGVLLYLILWVVMPEQVEGQGVERSGLDSVAADVRRLWAEVRAQFGTSAAPPAGAPGAIASQAQPATPATPVPGAAHNQSLVLGLLLVVIGLIILANNIGFVSWDVLWPAALIAAGVGLLIRALNRRT
jgi:phage shock protein C